MKYNISIKDSGFQGYYTLSTGKYLTSSEISVTIYQLTQRNILEDLNSPQHHWENLKSCITFTFILQGA
jgi:hypothetical protein